MKRWATTLRAAGRRPCGAVIAAGLVCGYNARKTRVFLFLWVSVCWFFQVGRRAAAASGLRRLGSAIEGHVVESSQDTRHEVLERFLPQLISLFGCSFCVVS